MSWREIPFVRLIIPFILGIVLCYYGQKLAFNLAYILLILSFLLFLIITFVPLPYRFRGLYGIPLSIFLFLSGYILTYQHQELNDKTHFQNYIQVDSTIYIKGIVKEKTEKTQFHRLIVAAQNLNTGENNTQNISGNMLIYLRKDSLNPPPQYGDAIFAQIKLRKIEEPKNPHAFDFKQYWHLQNIHYQGFIEINDLKIISHDNGNPIMALAMRWQTYFVEKLKTAVGIGDEWAVGAALLLGNKEAISDEIKEAYIESGAMHILAISGMHILMIFKLLEYILNIYKSGNRRWRWLRVSILIIVIALFTLLVGLGTSVLRAAIMASFMAVAKMRYQRVNILNILAASASLLLLYNPFWLFDIGFQLSYIAVAGIAFLTPFFERIIILENKYLRWVWGNLSVGFAAQIAVTPLALYYFHQFPIWFWLTGLVVGTLADLALMTGIVYFIVHSIPCLSTLIGKILFGFLWLMNNSVIIVDKLPFSLIDGFGYPLWVVLGLYIILFFSVKAIYEKRLRPFLTASFLILFLSIVYGFSDITKKPNKQIVVYHIPRNTLIDVMYRKKCYSFFEKSSENFSLKNKIKFAAENHRKALKIKELNEFNFNEYYKDNFLFYHRGIINIEGYTLLTLDNIPQNRVNLHINTVVLRGSPRLSIAQLTQYLRFDTLIFDTSNSKKQVTKWKIECQKLGLFYYDISENGAWVHNL